MDITSDSPTSHLRLEFENIQELLTTQPKMIQRFLESQARSIAEEIVRNSPQVKFMLPDRIVCEIPVKGLGQLLNIPADFREQMAGGIMDRFMRIDLRMALRQRLAELEQSNNQAVAVSAKLLRHVISMYMVHDMLPAGRSVVYQAIEGEEIPSIPKIDALEPESAITAQTDAIVEEEMSEVGRGNLLVPYVPYARSFFLPQWIAFDAQGKLLLGAINEAEAHIASMQRYITILHYAVALSPYMVADKEYQSKRYGILGQLINQGRAMAIYQTREIIETIKRRAAAYDLNRGLSLSLPYFDDQDLVMKTYDFTVIPAGRIMFVPGFVVRAAREEEVKIAQDTRLSHSTRKYLLSLIKMLEVSFIEQVEK